MFWNSVTHVDENFDNFYFSLHININFAHFILSLTYYWNYINKGNLIDFNHVIIAIIQL